MSDANDDTTIATSTNPVTIPDDRPNSPLGPPNAASSSAENAPSHFNGNGNGIDNHNDNKGANYQPGITHEKPLTNTGLGGNRKRRSFALLDGVFQDPESGDHERVTIDITRLPAILGRSNESDKGNPHFFGLGRKKALSRKHCTIYYRDREGGRVEWDELADKVVYQDPSRVEKNSPSGSKNKPPVRPNPLEASGPSHAEDGLPSHGFFVIECLGKNRILVDHTRVDQGESMVLRSGSAVRISSYMLYFMLPNDADPTQHRVELPHAPKASSPKASSPKASSPKAKASKKTASSHSKKAGSSSSSTSSSSNKKRPASTLASSAAAVSSSSSSSPSLSKKPKKASAASSSASASGSGGTSTSNATLAELETLPVEDLIERMNEAVTKGVWDRKHQFIGATICYHAVRSAAMAQPIQQMVADDGGVSRSDIMNWIEQSPEYGAWVQQMLSNMEPRSYQASITKSLLKSGFERNSGAGRYIKWKTPDDIPITAKPSAAAAKGKGKSKKKAAPKPAAVRSMGNDPPTPRKDEDENDDNDENDEEDRETEQDDEELEQEDDELSGSADRVEDNENDDDDDDDDDSGDEEDNEDGGGEEAGTNEEDEDEDGDEEEEDDRNSEDPGDEGSMDEDNADESDEEAE